MSCAKKRTENRPTNIFDCGPVFCPTGGRDGLPSGEPLPRWGQRISFVQYDLVGVGMIIITPVHSVCLRASRREAPTVPIYTPKYGPCTKP